MALTISTFPGEVITNAPEFTVTTSLSEDASHQNLRIRATVLIGGQAAAVAVLEQAKGLDNWDFFEVLKSLIGRCDIDINGSALQIGPAMGSELLTAWTNYGGSWDTFVTSGREISDAQDATGGTALSNDLGDAAEGDIFVIACENDYLDTGSADMVFTLTNTAVSEIFGRVAYSGLIGGKLQKNHIYFILCAGSTSTPALRWSGGGACIGSGTFSVHKISDFRNNPGVYFRIKFEEVYENASNVTTIGALAPSDTLLFIPAVMRRNDTFSSYIMDNGSKYFLTRLNGPSSASKNVVDSPVFKVRMGMEIRLMYAHVGVYLKAECIVDAGTNTQTNIPNAGWGMLVMNSSGGFSSDPDEGDETLVFILTSITGAGATIYASGLTVNCDQSCYSFTRVGSTNYPLMRALSFIGDLGEEVALFRGLETENGTSDKQFYRGQQRNPKVLKAYPLSHMMLRTSFETEAYRRLLYELLYTEQPVYMFGFYVQFYDAKYQEVTVITDEIPIENQRRLIESEIEVEYYE